MRPQNPLPLLLSVLFLMAGCSSAYYSAMEKVGVHKRDILVDRVEKARDSQEETKEQFASALERFSAVVNFEGGDLEDKYQELNTVFEESEEQAEEVRERIDAVEDVAEALFEEWEEELEQYSSASLRRSSERKLQQTRNHYRQLAAAMQRAEAKIDPVLDVLRDHVLFLKHNLNARAIASLQSELVTIRTDVNRLIKEMEASIKEADAFIDALKES